MKESWDKPSTSQQIPCRVENLCKTHGSGTEFLSKHPLPNSLVVDATQSHSCSKSTSAPTDREGQKLDTVGRRSYTLATFAVRVANYLAAMGAYHRHLWNEVLPALNAAPEDIRSSCLAHHQEAMSLACQERITARHVVEASSKQLATVVALC